MCALRVLSETYWIDAVSGGCKKSSAAVDVVKAWICHGRFLPQARCFNQSRQINSRPAIIVRRSTRCDTAFVLTLHYF